MAIALLSLLATAMHPACAGAQTPEPGTPAGTPQVPPSLHGTIDPRLLLTAEDRAAHAARESTRQEGKPSREPYILIPALVGALVVPFVALADSDHGLLGIGLIPYYMAAGALMGGLFGELLYYLVERPGQPPTESRQ
jgi:hypothetical protein